MTMLSDDPISRSDHDILCRMISMGKPHRAIPITGALCLAAACGIPGTIAMEALSRSNDAGDMRIGHPSGITVVGSEVRASAEGTKIERATIYRTARKLFQGEVFF
jgi:2-methylaconitate isomerase